MSHTIAFLPICLFSSPSRTQVPPFTSKPHRLWIMISNFCTSKQNEQVPPFTQAAAHRLWIMSINHSHSSANLSSRLRVVPPKIFRDVCNATGTPTCQKCSDQIFQRFILPWLSLGFCLAAGTPTCQECCENSREMCVHQRVIRPRSTRSPKNRSHLRLHAAEFSLVVVLAAVFPATLSSAILGLSCLRDRGHQHRVGALTFTLRCGWSTYMSDFSWPTRRNNDTKQSHICKNYNEREKNTFIFPHTFRRPRFEEIPHRFFPSTPTFR